MTTYVSSRTIARLDKVNDPEFLHIIDVGMRRMEVVQFDHDKSQHEE